MSAFARERINYRCRHGSAKSKKKVLKITTAMRGSLNGEALSDMLTLLNQSMIAARTGTPQPCPAVRSCPSAW
jgi:hypothetical protein